MSNLRENYPQFYTSTNASGLYNLAMLRCLSVCNACRWRKLMKWIGRYLGRGTKYHTTFHISYHPCVVYLPTWMVDLKCMMNKWAKIQNWLKFKEQTTFSINPCIWPDFEWIGHSRLPVFQYFQNKIHPTKISPKQRNTNKHVLGSPILQISYSGGDYCWEGGNLHPEIWSLWWMFYDMYINKFSTSNAKTCIVSQWKGEMIQTTIFPPVKVCVGGFNPS